MEMASYLAGERWSDHPRCTHPLLASVARLVNDLTSDGNRRRLVDLIRDPVVAGRLRPHLVVAIQRWVCHDPSFFVHERYLSEQLAVWAWPREVLEDLDVLGAVTPRFGCHSGSVYDILGVSGRK